MNFSDFVESVVKTPICCELKQHLDTLYENYTKGVTPAERTGHWIDTFGGCKCSECDCLEAGYSNYCPNCGARMVEPQERSEK